MTTEPLDAVFQFQELKDLHLTNIALHTQLMSLARQSVQHIDEKRRLLQIINRMQLTLQECTAALHSNSPICAMIINTQTYASATLHSMLSGPEPAQESDPQ